MKRKVAKKFSVRSFIEMNLAYKLVIVMGGYFWQEKNLSSMLSNQKRIYKGFLIWPICQSKRGCH